MSHAYAPQPVDRPGLPTSPRGFGVIAPDRRQQRTTLDHLRPRRIPAMLGAQKGSSRFISVSIAVHAEHLRHDGLARAHTLVEGILRLPMW
jgi:hypothetical protein